MPESNTFVFIDGSYFIFYRFYALVQWWKNAKKDQELTDPINNPEFKEKFKTTFVKKVAELKKKLKFENEIIFVGKDCPRKEIWRMKLFPEYKGTRVNDGFEGGPFFKLVYDEKLFEQGGVTKILSHDNLEADDCIALSLRQIMKTYPEEDYPEHKYIIIASDHDYLQLINSRVSIFTLKYKNLVESKTAFKDPKKNLFCKIVTGDKSDNIKGVFKRCGLKTAVKYYEDQDLFMEKCKKEKAGDNFELNNRIINFDEIPTELSDSFLAQNWFD